MMPLLSRSSLSGRLLKISFLVSTVALVLASLSFLLYDAFSFRANLIHSLQAEAQIIGTNSVSALLFDDRESAKGTLSALQHSPAVLSAVILKPDGSLFAAYPGDGVTPLPETPPLGPSATESHWGTGNRLLLGNRIEFQGKNVGSVYILATTNEVSRRVRRYLFIALLVLALSLGIALPLTGSLRRTIAEPIVDLANIARRVTLERDYSLRAPQLDTGDEIAVLLTAFNEMIEQVQIRDRALLASRDLLEQRVAKRTEQLQAANRELEAFSYSVAHDLRGPLDTLGNAAFLLNQNPAADVDDRTRELLAILPRASSRMSALIDDLLTLSKSKSAELHRQQVDLAEIARSVAQDLTEANPEREIALDIAEQAPAFADPGLIRVALQNLLSNAWKYTSRTDNPAVQFGVLERDGETIYFVRDNGAGFDASLKEKLFVPFQRLHSQDTFEGSGIGLATVHRVISRHGGRIWAESEVGAGATFFFTLRGEETS